MIQPEALIDNLPEDSWYREWVNSFPTAEMPLSFLLLASMSVHGACLGRACWFPDDFRQLYPMLNLLMIGPSGIGKSSSMEVARKFLLENLPAELRPQFIGGATTKEQLHADLLPLPHAILFASELASFFSKAKYMEPLIPYVCLVPETPVLKADLSWVPVGTLCKGDELVGFEEYPAGTGGRHLYKAVVTATGRNRTFCHDLSTDRGSITCSREHKFLIFREGQDRWIETKDLGTGDQIRWFGQPWKFEEDREAGYLAGLLNSEGNVHKYNVSFNQNKGSVLSRGLSALKTLGFPVRIYDHESEEDRCKVVKVGPLYERLRLLGSIRPSRLLENSELTWVGHRMTTVPAQWATVESNQEVGWRETVPLQTSTKTLISGGFYSHNTELLDYRPIEFRTKSGGIQRIPEPSVTVIGGSTKDWLSSALPDSAVGGGFLPRFLLVKEDHRRQRVANAQMSMSASRWKDVLDLRRAASEDFIHIVAAPRGPISFSDFATADAYQAWYNSHQPASGHLSPFSARAAEMVKRLSMLVALSSRRDSITEADLQAAIVIYRYCEQKLQEVVIPTSQTGKLLTFVLECIPPGGSTAMEIRKALRTQAPAQDVDKYLQSLILSGDVEYVEGKFQRIGQ